MSPEISQCSHPPLENKLTCQVKVKSIKIAGDMTMYFGRHNSGSGRYDFGRDDFRATWPATPRYATWVTKSKIRWDTFSKNLKYDREWSGVTVGGTPYNGLYGEAPPERDTFLRLLGTFLVEVYERVGKSVFSVCKKAKISYQMHFYGCEQV